MRALREGVQRLMPQQRIQHSGFANGLPYGLRPVIVAILAALVTLTTTVGDTHAQSSVPAAPTGLIATSVSHDSVTLSWDDPGDDIHHRVRGSPARHRQPGPRHLQRRRIEHRQRCDHLHRQHGGCGDPLRLPGEGHQLGGNVGAVQLRQRGDARPRPLPQYRRNPRA